MSENTHASAVADGCSIPQQHRSVASSYATMLHRCYKARNYKLLQGLLREGGFTPPDSSTVATLYLRSGKLLQRPPPGRSLIPLAWAILDARRSCRPSLSPTWAARSPWPAPTTRPSGSPSPPGSPIKPPASAASAPRPAPRSGPRQGRMRRASPHQGHLIRRSRRPEDKMARGCGRDRPPRARIPHHHQGNPSHAHSLLRRDAGPKQLAATLTRRLGVGPGRTAPVSLRING
jgi:hypothetical protein